MVLFLDYIACLSCFRSCVSLSASWLPTLDTVCYPLRVLYTVAGAAFGLLKSITNIESKKKRNKCLLIKEQE